jgi:hypothetical protein
LGPDEQPPFDDTSISALYKTENTDDILEELPSSQLVAKKENNLLDTQVREEE